MNINVKVGKYLVPDIQKIIWKKIFQECMTDLKEKTNSLRTSYDNSIYRLFYEKCVGLKAVKLIRVDDGHWRLIATNKINLMI